MKGSPKFIFTLTTGHSGGTLLNLLLGASPAISAVGESLRVSNLHKLASQPDETRSHWAPAIEKLVSKGWKVESLDARFMAKAPLDFWRDWTSIIADLNPSTIAADKTLSLSLIERICGSGLVDPYFVHLIRDPHAVCYSYHKKGASTWRQARSWNKSHQQIEKFLATRTNFIQVKYEDLVVDTWKNLKPILESAGEHFQTDLLEGTPQDLGERSLDDSLFENHIYAGNRMRHGQNRAGKKICLDTAFVDSLPDVDWAITNLFCSKRLQNYGYALRRDS